LSNIDIPYQNAPFGGINEQKAGERIFADQLGNNGFPTNFERQYPCLGRAPTHLGVANQVFPLVGAAVTCA
jgi:hypothetical protein